MAEARSLLDALYPQQRAPEEWRGRLGFDALEADQGLPPGLLTAVLQAESAGKPHVVSAAGAQGLFQFMPATARGHKIDPFDPQQAAPAAAQELGTLYRKYDGDMPSVLAAWNWGQGNLDKQGMGKAPAETRGFIASVLGRLVPRSAEAAEGQQTVAPLVPRAPQDVSSGGRSLFNDLYGPSRATEGAAPAAPAAPVQAPAPSAPEALPEVVPNPDPTQPATLRAPGTPGTVPASVSGPVEQTPGVPLLREPALPMGREPGTPTPGSDLTINIEKASTPEVPGPFGGTSLAERRREPEGIDEVLHQAFGDYGPEYLKRYGAMALGGLGTMGTVAAAARLGLPKVLEPVIAGVGSYGMHRAGQALGLAPGEPEVLPKTLDDYLALALPMLPGLIKPGQALLRWTRGGQAITQAETETAQQAAKDLRTYQQGEAARRGQEARRASNIFEDVQLKLERRQAAHAQKVLDAETAWNEAEDAAQRLAGTQNADALREANTVAAQRIRDYKTAVQEFQAARTQHTEAVQRLQALPRQYMPQLPARTARDVLRDLDSLDMEGATVKDVLKRLKVNDVRHAETQLTEELATFPEAEVAAARAATPGEAVPPSFRTRATREPANAPGPELQTFIRSQRGMKLEGEELQSELNALTSRKETGISGLRNARSGKTAQQMAEAAQEAGYIPTADTEALLEALRRSVTEGKPVYSTQQAGELFGGSGGRGRPAGFAGEAEGSTGPAPRPGSSARHPVSSQLYRHYDAEAGATPVDFTPSINAAQSVQARLDTIPPHRRPASIQGVVTDLLEMSTEGNASQAYETMKSLGPLMRSKDGAVRSMAGELFEGLHDAMETSAPRELRQLLGQAKGAWKQEEGVATLQDLLSTSRGGLSLNDQGQLVLNVKTLLNQVRNSKDLQKWFTPEQYAALQNDAKSFVGTPAYPTQAPPLPGSVPVQRFEPEMPRNLTNPADIPPFQAPALTDLMSASQRRGVRPSPAEPFTPSEPVAPKTKRYVLPGLLERPVLSAGGGLGAASYFGSPTTAAVTGAAIVGDELLYRISQVMISERYRPLFLKAVRADGTLTPRAYAILAEVAKAEGDMPEGSALSREPGILGEGRQEFDFLHLGPAPQPQRGGPR